MVRWQGLASLSTVAPSVARALQPKLAAIVFGPTATANATASRAAVRLCPPPVWHSSTGIMCRGYSPAPLLLAGRLGARGMGCNV
jgi:hypothetical protein